MKGKGESFLGWQKYCRSCNLGESIWNAARIFFYHQHPWETFEHSYRTAEKKQDKMTNNDRYCIVVPWWGKEMKKKRLTISAFLYPCSLFVVCFVRVFLMLVFKMCSVSPVDATSWENRNLLQRQNTTFVLEWVEESIKIPREKFPESMKGEVCLICSLRCVRMLTYIQTHIQGRAHTRKLKNILWSMISYTKHLSHKTYCYTHTHTSTQVQILCHPVE